MPPTSPKLGIALGGGVARGWAHIGVLRALSEAGIVPDVVCGTSIGAVVGGLYVAGRLDDVEEWARSLNRLKIVSYLDFKMRHPGLIGGDRLVKELQLRLGDQHIEDLASRFAAVCTDLTTGQEVWLTTGSLVEAVRASFSMPGVFSPVRLDERWLVDGALVNPVPVSVCAALGADLVVAVNVSGEMVRRAGRDSALADATGFDLIDMVEGAADRRPWSLPLNGMVRRIFRRDRDTPSLFGVMASSLGIIQDRITRSRLAGEPPDIHITPRVGHIGLAEFDRADELIRRGTQAAEAALPDIRDAMRAYRGHGRRAGV